MNGDYKAEDDVQRRSCWNRPSAAAIKSDILQTRQLQTIVMASRENLSLSLSVRWSPMRPYNFLPEGEKEWVK